MKNVMVVIDESNSSYDVLVWVLQNLKDISDSNKLLIFAKQPQSSVTPISLSSSTSSTKEYEDCSGYTRESQEDMWKSWGIISLPDHLMKSLVQKYLYSGHQQPFVEKVGLITINQQIKADTFTDVGDPNEPIHKIIQERKVNLLVTSDQQNQSLKK
ncbi:hypothetical protein YC2023_074156 [Brassica napus]